MHFEGMSIASKYKIEFICGYFKLESSFYLWGLNVGVNFKTRDIQAIDEDLSAFLSLVGNLFSAKTVCSVCSLKAIRCVLLIAPPIKGCRYLYQNCPLKKMLVRCFPHSGVARVGFPYQLSSEGLVPQPVLISIVKLYDRQCPRP